MTFQEIPIGVRFIVGGVHYTKTETSHAKKIGSREGMRYFEQTQQVETVPGRNPISLMVRKAKESEEVLIETHRMLNGAELHPKIEKILKTARDQARSLTNRRVWEIRNAIEDAKAMLRDFPEI